MSAGAVADEADIGGHGVHHPSPPDRTVMNYLRSFLAPRPACALSARLRVESLEDRTVPSGTEWLLRLEGLTGTTTAEQMAEAAALIEAAHIDDMEIEVVDHATIDGNIVIETPELTPQSVLQDRLQVLPGFIDVQPFVGEEEEQAPSDLENGGGAFESDATDGPVGPGPNLSVGLFSNEPTIAVNPLNPQNVVIGNFNGGSQTLKISLDGGATFPITRNGVLPAGQSFFQGDDSLAFDSQGRLFWSYLTGPSGPNVVSLQVNPTTGVVVGSPSFVATNTGSQGLDKEWIAADANPTSPFRDRLYVIWHDFNLTNAPVRFARSTNQGATWTTLGGNLSGANEGFTWPSEVAVAPNGDVWVAWHTNTGATNGEVRMRRSTDGGVTFGPEIIPFPAGTGATTTNSASGLTAKITGLHVWLQGSMQPRLLVDPARPGNMYVVSVDDPDNFVPTDDPSDIVIARSTDNGGTWTRSTISQGIYGDSEFMPAASIDASGNIAVTWYDNRRHLTVPDSLGGTHYLLDLMAATSGDGGVTFTAPFRVNDSANAFDPERGAPDRFGNHTLRIGEYNGLSLVNGVGYAVWTGNTASAQQVMFDKFNMGLTVTSTVPAVGSVVSTQPTTFTVNVSSPVNPATLNASDFTVNGVPATGFSYTPGTATITFTYLSSPVTVQGVQTMHVDAGAFTRASDGSAVAAFNGTFRYDAVTLQVVSTNPPFPNGVFTLPAPFTSDVTFNEPVDPASVQTSDLVLTGALGATVTGATVLPGNTTVRFTIGGITAESTLTASIAAGAVTDAFGNPGLAFSSNYQVDLVTAPYPTPLTAENPPGSLIYDPSVAGIINFAGDTDTFTLAVDPGQTITVLVTPTSASLRPSVTLLNPSGVAVATATAAAANQKALLQTFAVAAGGTYSVVVSGALSTTGSYTAQVTLNAVLANEGNLVGVTDNTRATAQDLTGSFVTLQTPQASASRGAAVGQFQGDDDFYSFPLTLGQPVTLGLSLANVSTSVFGARTDISGGFIGPSPVTYGDLNGDGKQDMVVGNYSSSTVTVLLGNGAGGFGAPTSFSLGGSNPWTVVLDDMNGDGRRDIIASNIGSGTVSVLLGNGAGGFGAPATYTVGTSPYGLATGDLNGDGFPDVISANYNSSSITVLFGSASGVLTPTTNYLLTGNPVAVAIADLNGDGRRDVVTANYGGNTITVMLNTGGGVLGGATFLPVGSNPFSIALADLSGDGILDVATANFGSNNVSVRFGTGTGAFSAVSNYPSGGSGPYRVAVGDLNADGKLDLAAVNNTNNAAGVLLNNGAGAFGAAQIFATGSSPYGLALADLNGDGLLDMSTTNNSANTVSVWLNTTAQVRFELQDASGTVLATGVPAANLSAVINNVVAPATGTYYARVFGTGASAYDLVVTRDAAFDTESNDTFAVPQSVGGAQGALGAIKNPVITTSTVVPFSNTNAEGDFSNGFPFHIGATNPTFPSMRYQQIYSNSQFTSGGVIDKIRFRKDVSFGANFSTAIDLKVNLSYSATSPTAPSTVFANNVGAGVVTVFDGLVTLSSSGTGSPNPFDIVIDVADLFGYNPAQGNLLVDFFVRNSPVTTFFDAVGTSQTVTSRIFSSVNVNDTVGQAFQSGLVTRFDMVAPGPVQEDWYSVNVGSTANLLRLETGTPADGPNQFVNNLNPKIELYNPSGALVASGTAVDGRNEFLQYLPAVTGNYRVRLIGESGTVGEYFLSKNFGPVVTSLSILPINENDTAILNGTLSDPDTQDTHTVVINWGPSEGTTTVNLAAGVSTFSASHQYLDDNPTGTSSDAYPISVTVADNHGAAGSGSTSVTVSNVAPSGVTLNSGTIDEGGTFTLNGAFTDPGTQDTHTVLINWGPGEGTTLLNLAAGVTSFTASHPYFDDNPTGTASDTYPIGVTVTDDDGGVGTGGSSVTVNNVAPVVTSLTPAASINENDTYTLNGTFHDAGTLDTHSVLIGWGPGEGSTSLANADLTYLGNGDWSFTASHQYRDDSPSGTAADDYALSVTVSDDDAGVGTEGTSVTVNNVAPANVVLNSGTINENDSFSLTGSFTDPGTLDTHTVVINWGPGEGSTTLNLAAGVSTFSATHQYFDDNPSGTASDTYPIGVTVTDDDTGVGAGSSSVTVNNLAPSGLVLNSGTINENDSFTLTGSFADVGTQDTHTVVINWGPYDGTTTLNLAAGVYTFSATHQYLDDNPTGTASDTNMVTVTVTDDDTGSATNTTSVTVNNVDPVVADVVAPIDPVPAGSPSPVNVSSSFTDVGTADSYTVQWEWGNGSSTTYTLGPSDPKTLSATYAYMAAGVYTVTLTVTDDDTGTASKQSGFVVVYDPSAGFVTGGGWIDSPAGAYTADPTLTGKATFGFVSRYKKGANAPDGNTVFQFHAAGFEFKSTSYDWMVVAGAKAQYKGSGTVNGVAGYRFMLTAIDGQRNGGGGVDKFRIKIWDSSGTIVYDNQLGASDTADPVTRLGGGSIQIQS